MNSEKSNGKSPALKKRGKKTIQKKKEKEERKKIQSWAELITDSDSIREKKARANGAIPEDISR